jgi:hypothetical protein
VISGPYLGKTPRALGDKLEVLERGSDLVLAHFTDVGWGLTAPPWRPFASSAPSGSRSAWSVGRCRTCSRRSSFAMSATGPTSSTAASSDLWALGKWWGARVARRWEETVAASVQAVRVEAERRAAS